MPHLKGRGGHARFGPPSVEATTALTARAMTLCEEIAKESEPLEETLGELRRIWNALALARRALDAKNVTRADASRVYASHKQIQNVTALRHEEAHAVVEQMGTLSYQLQRIASGLYDIAKKKRKR